MARSRSRSPKSKGTEEVSHEELVKVALAQGCSQEDAIRLADNMKQGKDVMRLVHELEQQAAHAPALSPPGEGLLAQLQVAPLQVPPPPPSAQVLPPPPPPPMPEAIPLRSAQDLLQHFTKGAEAQGSCARFVQLLEEMTEGFNKRMLESSSQAEIALDDVREELCIIKEAMKVAKTTAKRRYSLTLPGEEDDTATAKIEVSGFSDGALNQVYSADPKTIIDGTPVFVGQGHFLYKRAGLWRICPEDETNGENMLPIVQQGENRGVAAQEEAAGRYQVTQQWLEPGFRGWTPVSIQFQRKGPDPDDGTMAPGTPD